MHEGKHVSCACAMLQGPIRDFPHGGGQVASSMVELLKKQVSNILVKIDNMGDGGVSD